MGVLAAALAMPAVGGTVVVIQNPNRGRDDDPPRGLGEWMSRKNRRRQQRRGKRSNDPRYVTKGIAKSRAKEKARRQARAGARK